MDTTAGLRMLRSLPADAGRDVVGDTLVKACLGFISVESAEVTFLPEETSEAAIPAPVLSSLIVERIPLAMSGHDGNADFGSKSVLFVPLVTSENVLAVLKLSRTDHAPFDEQQTSAFECLASYAAILIERAAMEAGLVDARERTRLTKLELELFWDRLPAHAWQCRPDGRLVAVNQEFAEYYGLVGEKIAEFGYHSIFHPDDYPRVMEIWARAISEGVPGVAESRMVQADGTSRSFLIRVVPIRDDDGSVISWYGINTDVEDLKIAQRESARTAAALAEGQKMSRTGSWSWRPDANSFTCSGECARIFGLDADPPPTFEAMLERVHPDDRLAIDPVGVASVSTAPEMQNEMRILFPEGATTIVETRTRIERDTSGQALEYVGTVRDITDAKIAQDRIQESERRYEATLSSIGDAVISTDDKGRLIFINPVAQRLTGWTQSDAADQPVEQVFRLVNDTREFVDNPISEILGRKSDPASGHQYALRSKNGSEIMIEVSGAPIIDTRNDMTGAVLVFRDMTQRNETEQALRRSNEDLARMSRLTAIGELAVSIAHEMNQPLMAIVTNAAASMAWLDSRSPNVQEALQSIDRVIKDGHRAGVVLGGILALARNSRPKIEEVSVRSVISEVLQLTKSELRQRNVLVSTAYDESSDAVNGDRIQLQQVLINLIMNGADAMASVEARRKTLHLATRRQPDGLIQVSVSDMGVGLDEETADKAFDAFFTTKATGIGMGLSICRSIIEAHGGQIWMNSEKSKGSTFSFTLQPPPSSRKQSSAHAT